MFGVSQKEHKLYVGNTKYRNKVLSELIFNNPNLKFVDSVSLIIFLKKLFINKIDTYYCRWKSRNL